MTREQKVAILRKDLERAALALAQELMRNDVSGPPPVLEEFLYHEFRKLGMPMKFSKVAAQGMVEDIKGATCTRNDIFLHRMLRKNLGIGLLDAKNFVDLHGTKIKLLYNEEFGEGF